MRTESNVQYPEDFEYRDSHLSAGPAYDRFFNVSPRLDVLTKLEKRFLDDIFLSSVIPRGGRIRALDFACGTGRILKWLEAQVDDVTGVDVSESMLQMAKGNGCRATLVCADLTTQPGAVCGAFEVITAFRFFANAQASLRESVITKLASLLSPGGVLIFNNHCRYESLNERIRRAVRRLRGQPVATGMGRGMTDEEVRQLLHLAGLREIASRHCGVLPVAHGWLPMPKAMYAWIEWTLSKWRWAKRYAQHHMIVCVRE